MANQFGPQETGEIAVGTSIVAGSDVACRFIRFIARATNTGYIYVGGATVTAPDGATDVTTGLELGASGDTGWIPTDNLSRFGFIASAASQALTYMAIV
jgi:hypothetical protein